MKKIVFFINYVVFLSRIILISIILNLSQDGVDFEGGGTYFPQHEKLIKEPKGNLVVHPGRMTHWHGVRPITSGERYVIVSFCKEC